MPNPPVLSWDDLAGRYRRADGRFVPATQVREELDKALSNAARRTVTLADDYRAGRIGLVVWRLQMRQVIKETHLYAAALAQGGWAQMTPEAYGRVGQVIRLEYGFLEQWVGQIQGGWVLDGRLTSRSQLYAAAARGTFHRIQAEQMLRRGMDMEKSVLHPAEHCAQCVSEAAHGFRPIGEMVPIGQRTCLRNCKCTVVYGRSSEMVSAA